MFLAYVPQSEAQGRGRLFWIGGHLGLAAILDWQPSWIGRSNFAVGNFPTMSPLSKEFLKDEG